MNETSISNALKDITLQAVSKFKISELSELPHPRGEKVISFDKDISEQVSIGNSCVTPYYIDDEEFSKELSSILQPTKKCDAYGSFDFVLPVENEELEARYLNSHDNDDHYELDHFFSAVFLVDNRCYIVELLINNQSPMEIDAECVVSVEKLDLPITGYSGKRASYTYRKIGISLRFTGNENSRSIPRHREHAHARNWGSAPRHFYLTRPVKND